MSDTGLVVSSAHERELRLFRRRNSRLFFFYFVLSIYAV